ncbi:MAG: DUF2892 domain-containing protein [Candidatus Izemoplasmataceae bacterium]|jgi:ABC-type polysaccharide/polyol phosphate export permease|uniref:YgaP family membrane protein n=1 Tax=Liberiplasma polymorphum TaxID=3374570 RepID=UPI0037709552
MKNNVGKVDQTIRYIIAIVLIVIAVVLSNTWTWAWLLLIPAVILALTAAVGWCGFYKLFGVNTCKINPPKE